MADWSALDRDEVDLRRQMETRFRAAFPDAVAVVDPALQMRRKLAEARHVAGKPDNGDFLPMIENIAIAHPAVAMEAPVARVPRTKLRRSIRFTTKG